MAITSWPGFEYLYLAEQRRLGHRYGLDLRVQQYTSIEDQRLAYGRGDVEVIATNLPDAITICQEVPKRCPELFLVIDQSEGADVIISKSDIGDVRGLVGQTVGLERTVLSEYLLLRAFETKQVPFDQVHLMHEGPSALVSALSKGKVAAIVTYPPHSNLLREDSRYRVLFSSAQIPGEIVDILAVNPAFAKRHPGMIRALVRTWWAAQALARAEPISSQALMAKREQVSPAEFVASERGIRYPTSADQAEMLAPTGSVARVLARMAGQMISAGRLSAKTPLPTPTQAFLPKPEKMVTFLVK
ncbi:MULTISPECIES: ABC transporter substrate-binding protein [unclassified Cyanobium]|uniref:ABC transporter substrate-binding protein n=1 Tax=unclassified Cyanobium TaxID=2627006 RepID=UPI0020CE655B|nr:MULTISPECIES: ABC transporter substrate-binding protein [unclassified Cyanobium]MCP9776553.1 ABC transporter substrate-binding protein [Cyanobium sp. Tous-M-B4]MCP9876422.1 ABC transporter substrate-binding protein [Cyanobium sp. A2C-AMD]